MPLDIDIHNLD